jgi:hypothetical protein
VVRQVTDEVEHRVARRGDDGLDGDGPHGGAILRARPA